MLTTRRHRHRRRHAAGTESCSPFQITPWHVGRQKGIERKYLPARGTAKHWSKYKVKIGRGRRGEVMVPEVSQLRSDGVGQVRTGM